MEWWRCVCAHSRGGRQGTLLPQSFMLRRLKLGILPSELVGTARCRITTSKATSRSLCTCADLGWSSQRFPP